MKRRRDSNADAVTATLNPIITGWAAYHRIGDSKRAFAALDAHVWRLVCKWARFRHSNKPMYWVKPAISARSAPPERTRGCSAATTVASTCANSLGHRSSDTGWSQARRLRTTLP
ncbi:group II intron maturase-specific domain-containing protein [Nocardia sp. NPDC004278]